MTGEILSRTARAMVDEIRRSPHRGRPAKTIFFGGGTPTFFSTEDLLSIFEAVLEVHPPVPDAEITSEANPGTADAEKFGAMRTAGFNRLSLGAQSFFADDLIRLGRVHREDEIGRAVQLARDAGFDNLNLDLMFALPGQSMAAWERNLARAAELNPDHLSLYCLTLEPNTAFYKEHLRGLLIQPDEDAQVAMYDRAVSVAAENGYLQYEISNFSRPGRESQHNLCYWRGEEYAGYGPGAVGRVGSRRATVLKHPLRYCEALESEAAFHVEEEDVDAEMLRTERIMLGLRLHEGLPSSLVSPSGMAEATRRGWLSSASDRVFLTPEGRHFCTEVAALLL
jgi:oxygen-independent coproporphyrinogen III oxidase